MLIQLISGRYPRGFIEIPLQDSFALYVNITSLQTEAEYENYMTDLNGIIMNLISSNANQVTDIKGFDFPWSFNNVPSEEDFLNSMINVYAVWKNNWINSNFFIKDCLQNSTLEYMNIIGVPLNPNGFDEESQSIFSDSAKSPTQDFFDSLSDDEDETQATYDNTPQELNGFYSDLNNLDVLNEKDYDALYFSMVLALYSLFVKTSQLAHFENDKIYFVMGDVFGVLFTLDRVIEEDEHIILLNLGYGGPRGILLVQMVSAIFQNIRSILCSIIQTLPKGAAILEIYQENFDIKQIAESVEFISGTVVSPWYESEKLAIEIQRIWISFARWLQEPLLAPKAQTGQDLWE